MCKVIVSLCLSVHTPEGYLPWMGGTYLGWWMGGGYLPWTWVPTLARGWGYLSLLEDRRGGGVHQGRYHFTGQVKMGGTIM